MAIHYVPQGDGLEDPSSLSFGHFGSVAVYFQGHSGHLAVKPENQVHLPNRGNIKALQPTHP